MNTIGKSVTCNFYKNAEAYARLKAAWSQAMQARTKLSAAHHTLYLILCGKNWTRGFTQAKRFVHPAELAIVRVRYHLSVVPKLMRKERSKVYEYFSEYLADDAEDYIEPLLPKITEIESAIKEGNHLEPYRVAAVVPGNG